jgi:hypothetical protein
MANQVTASLGITLNIGNFQSARVDCGVTADVRDGETTDDAMRRVYDYVEQFVDEKVKEMQKDIESA